MTYLSRCFCLQVKKKTNSNSPNEKKKKSEKVESEGGEGGRIGKKILRLHQMFIRTLLMTTNQNPTEVDQTKQNKKEWMNLYP